MYCPKCRKNTDNKYYCSACSYDFSCYKPIENVISVCTNYIECSGCHAELDDNENYCYNCGKEIPFIKKLSYRLRIFFCRRKKK